MLTPDAPGAPVNVASSGSTRPRTCGPRRGAARVRPCPARGRRAGHRGPRRRPSSTPSPRWAWTTGGRPTAPGRAHAVRVARRPRAATTRSSRPGSGAPGRGRRPATPCAGRSRRPGSPARTPGRGPARTTTPRSSRPPRAPREVLRHRDVADLSRAEQRAAGRAVRGAAPAGRRAAGRTGTERWHRGAASTPAAPCAATPAPDGRARRDRVAPTRHPPAAGRAARRRLRLDEPLRRRAAAARARLTRARRGSAAEVVHRSAPGSPTSPGRCALRDPDRAMVAAGEAVPDWSGGTRLGETLQGLPRPVGPARHGARCRRGRSSATAGSAATPEALGEQMRRLHAAGPPGGVGQPAPRQGRLRAGAAGASWRPCRTVDDFVAGHSLATFERAHGGGGACVTC